MAPRRKPVCPKCGVKVAKLPRHLRETHKMSKDATNKLVKGESREFRIPSITKFTSGQTDFLECFKCGNFYGNLSRHILKAHPKVLSKGRRKLVRKSKGKEVSSSSGSDSDDTEITHESEPTIASPQLVTPAPTALAPQDVVGPSRRSSRITRLQLQKNPYVTGQDTDTKVCGALEEKEGSETNDKCALVNFVEKFVKWLKTDEGGSNDTENAREYGRKIKRMTEFGVSRIKDTCDRQKINKLFQEMPPARAFKPGTTASYLVALRMLVRFALLEEKITTHQYDIAMTTTSFIRKTVNTKKKEREAELEEELDDKMIGEKEVNEYLQSDFARSCEDTINNPPVFVSAVKYRSSRNHLIARLALSNRQRAGALGNISVLNIQKAKKTVLDGETVYTFLVTGHKTTTTYGSGTLCADEELYTLLSNFVNNIRLKTFESTDPSTDFAWLEYVTGKKLPNKRMSRSIAQAWKKGGQKKDVSTTILRKSIVTKAYEEAPEEMAGLADHMTHTRQVQARYYNLSKKRTNTAKAYKLIKNLTKKTKK